MREFTYTAYDETGGRRQGEITAASLESARFKLKERGLVPVQVDHVDATADRISTFLRFNRRPGSADVEILTSQLSLLLGNGIKIDRALENARKGIKNNRLRKIVSQVYEDIKRGTPLSLALEKNPDVFDPLYVSVVRIGETTGRLGDIFSQLAANLSFKQKVAAETRQAMIYPAIISLVCLLSVLFILNFIVPKFSVLFSSMKNLPIYTDILLKASHICRKYQLVIPGAAAGLFFLAARLKKKAYFKKQLDILVLKVPVVRRLCYTLENLRFTSSLSILLKSGVVLSEALDYAVQSVGNLAIRKQLLIVKNEIKQGGKFSEAMTRTGFLPEIFAGLLEVGEQTGNLAEVFSEMEQRLKSQYEGQVANLITIIEPLMIIFMSLVVGSIVAIMLLSMVSVNDINF